MCSLLHHICVNLTFVSFGLCLSDEPVTEGYRVLGFPIWRGSRRDGRCISLSLSVCLSLSCSLALTQYIVCAIVFQWIAFAGPVIVALILHTRHLHVGTAWQRGSARCAIVGQLCCIHSLENSHMATAITFTAASTTEHRSSVFRLNHAMCIEC